jgi:hypothetical protein
VCAECVCVARVLCAACVLCVLMCCVCFMCVPYVLRVTCGCMCAVCRVCCLCRAMQNQFWVCRGGGALTFRCETSKSTIKMLT